MFIEGRSGEITDVFLDSQGVLLGILIIMLILKITNEIKNRKSIKVRY